MRKYPVDQEELDMAVWLAENTTLTAREIPHEVKRRLGRDHAHSPSRYYDYPPYAKAMKERKKKRGKVVKARRSDASPELKKLYDKIDLVKAESELEEELSKLRGRRLSALELLKMRLDFKDEIEDWLFYCDKVGTMFGHGDGKGNIYGVLGYQEPEKIRVLLKDALKMLDKSKSEEEIREITDYAVTQAINNISNNPPHVRLEKCRMENVNVLVYDNGRVLCPRRWKDEDGSWNCLTLELEEDLGERCPFRRYKFIQEIEVPYS